MGQDFLHNSPRTKSCSVGNIQQVRETLGAEEQREGFKAGTNLSRCKARALL